MNAAIRPEFILAAVLIVGGTVASVTLATRRSRRVAVPVAAAPAVAAAETPSDTFDRVAGADEAVTELREIKEYLVEPERFRALGARLPKGVLLVGPPGCGKTLLARALAAEAGVRFYAVSASSFLEMFVGVGAARVRQLFDEARKQGPSIVFIDELDAIGRRRTTSASGGQEERESTLNQLLVAMDGFESGAGVLVVAATNRPDVLDPALLRPGRFDRRVTVDLPDVRGRESILRVHGEGKPLAPSVRLDDVARRTVGFSGADLSNVMNEAALLAARERARAIAAVHVSEAIERVLAGPARPTRVLDREERERIAYHEAGHAVASAALPGADQAGKVSIVARGQTGGFTWTVPATERVMATRSQLLDRIATLVAGKAAEELVFGEPSTGVADDLRRAAEIATYMVDVAGMTRPSGLRREPLGGGAEPDGSRGEPAGVGALLEEAEDRAATVLVQNRALLDAVATRLLERESVEGEELRAMLREALAVPPAPRRGSTGRRRADGRRPPAHAAIGA